MSGTPSQELIDLILHGSEERNLEYKESMSWSQRDVKVEITRCILGMANLRDGGAIVLGVEQRGSNFVLAGMRPEHVKSFSHDRVAPYVSERADPFVEIEITPVSHEEKEFIVIQVREFDELPVICKREGKLSTGNLRLRRGVIYIRSRRMCETIEVPSQTEMREIIELAVDKGVRRFMERMGRTGILSLVMEPSDSERFDEQLGELK